MKGEKLTITIDEAGNVAIDANGFHGHDCSKIQDEMSKALGKTTKVVTKKEFYQATVTKKASVIR